MPSTAYSYRALRERISGAHENVCSRSRGFCGYTADEVTSRYVQRCLEIGVFEFTKAYADRFRTSGQFPQKEEVLVCGGIVFDADRDVGISTKQFWREFTEYAGYWLYVFAILVISLRWRTYDGSIVLLHGVGIDDITAEGNDERFLKFCSEGPITPLNRPERLVVQATRDVNTKESARVRYGRFPLLVALQWVGLNPKAWLVALVMHCMASVSFLMTVLRSPRLILLGRDAAYHAPAMAMARKGKLRDVVITNSNYFSQPLWMWALPDRSHRLHMVWYSQNNYPIVYRDEPVREPIPNLRFVRVDTHWVWTNGFATFLADQGLSADIHVVGPVVWCLPGNPAASQNMQIRVGLFDVTPINDDAERKFGLLRNFYSGPNISRFLEDSVNVAHAVAAEMGLDLEVVLKHKRGHSAIHAEGYISCVNDLVAAKRLKLVEHTTNIFDLVESCTVVIVTPFSSPIYVAQSRGVEAVWYDPTGLLVNPEEDTSAPCLIGNPDKLASLFRVVFAAHLNVTS